MQLCKHNLYVVLSVLLLFFIADFAVADITGGEKHIDGTHLGYVIGNKNDEVPPAGDATRVNENQVIIENGGIVNGSAYGGLSYGNGAVERNSVIIEDGGIAAGSTYGGFTYGNSVVNDNSVIIKGNGTAQSHVVGGYTEGKGDVTYS